MHHQGIGVAELHQSAQAVGLEPTRNRQQASRLVQDQQVGVGMYQPVRGAVQSRLSLASRAALHQALHDVAQFGNVVRLVDQR